jgi:PAS domain S-box-containing protein
MIKKKSNEMNIKKTGSQDPANLRKRAERELQILSARNQAILEAIPDIIVEVDKNKVYTWANRSGLDFFGEDVIGKEAAFYFEGEQETYDKVQLLFEGAENTIYLESWQRRQDAQKRLLAWWCRVLKDQSGQVIGALSSARDITERKRLEKEKETMLRALLTKNEELERFTYSVSHNLKSPLVTIRTFLGHLEQDMVGMNKEQIKQDIGYIRNGTERMSKLLDELLKLSRIRRSTNPPEEVSLQSIVKEASGLVAGRITERGVKVVVADTKFMLWGDRVRLLEVFQNLLDNACKFMGEQKAPLIEIGAETKDGEAVIYVRDNGSGITPQILPKLFIMFEKLDRGTEGDGIGLALVKRIVEVHGGRIWVESEGTGQGACFKFTLGGKNVRHAA